MRVLVVDSDENAAARLAGKLARNGHQVSHASSGRAALLCCAHADLILLDLQLPDRDGVSLCREIRAHTRTPLITFSTADMEPDRVLSLRAGADDCMVKPVGYRELIARIEAVTRRATARAGASPLRRGALRVDPRSRQVHLGERAIELTRKEFDVLYLLASFPETVVSRAELMARVWADESMVSNRTVDTHVSTLRGKLGDRDWILTVRGVGYRLGEGEHA